MSVEIDAIDYWAGSPKWLNSYTGPGYWIRGRGFGARQGLVTIDGEAQNVVSWEPDKILIAKSDHDSFWNTACPPAIEVTTARRRRMAANDACYVRVAA